MGNAFAYAWKVVLIAGGSALAWALACQWGPWLGLAAWTGIMAIACGGAALLLKTSPIGRITWRNRLAGYVLPW